jgi:nickel transport protein
MRHARASAVLVAGALLLPLAAAAHEVLHTIERGSAVAVKASFADGEDTAYVQYEVFSPADPKIPFQKGRTDRRGYLAFVPDSPGKWRVRIVDDTGHGLDTEIDADPPAAPAAGKSAERSSAGELVSGAAFVLRPLVGLMVIGLVFGALYWAYRRRRTGP